MSPPGRASRPRPRRETTNCGSFSPGYSGWPGEAYRRRDSGRFGRRQGHRRCHTMLSRGRNAELPEHSEAGPRARLAREHEDLPSTPAGYGTRTNCWRRSRRRRRRAPPVRAPRAASTATRQHSRTTCSRLSATGAHRLLTALPYSTTSSANSGAGTGRSTLSSRYSRGTHGITQKYAGRVRKEVERSYNKVTGAALSSVAGAGGSSSGPAAAATGGPGGGAGPAAAASPAPHVIPTIRIIDGQLPSTVEETERALVSAGLPIFARAGTLVEPVSESMMAANGRKTVARGSAHFVQIRCWSRSPAPRFSNALTASETCGWTSTRPCNWCG